jgi:hypothetical protein
VNAALELARSYGIDICFADLGDWGSSELRSEYDPDGPTIRINVRVAERLEPSSLGSFVTWSVGHELYHHRERIGEIERLRDRQARESAADEYARNLVEESR